MAKNPTKDIYSLQELQQPTITNDEDVEDTLLESVQTAQEVIAFLEDGDKTEAIRVLDEVIINMQTIRNYISSKSNEKDED